VSWARSDGVAGVQRSTARSDIGVEKKVQVGVRHFQHQRGVIVERETQARHVGAAEHAQARLAVALRGFLADVRAIEEALHVRQESDELLVMALLELLRVAEEFVDHFRPRALPDDEPSQCRCLHALQGMSWSGTALSGGCRTITVSGKVVRQSATKMRVA
jgi:hypothetical protein